MTQPIMTSSNAEPTGRRTLPLYALMLAGVISLAGNSVALLAVPWYVHRTTGNDALVGLAAAAGIAAYVIGSFFGGNLADRFDRRDVSVVADLTSGLMILAIPVLAAAGLLSFGLLITFVFLSALLDAPGQAARSAMVPELARLGGFALERANGLIFGSASLAEVLGPALAGILLVSLSTASALVVDGLSFFVSLALTLAFVPRGLGRETGLGEDDIKNVALRDGLRLLAKPGAPRLITLANVATNFIGAPLFTVIMVVYLAQEAQGGLALGAVVAIGGVGMTLGALAFSRWGQRMPRKLFFLIGFAAFGLQYWFLALNPPVVAILVIFFVRGLLTGSFNPICDTVLQERVPGRMLATIYGTSGAIAIIGEPLGLIAGGFIAERYGVHTAIVVSAVAYAAVTIALLFARSLRDLAAPEEKPEENPEEKNAPVEGVVDGAG